MMGPYDQFVCLSGHIADPKVETKHGPMTVEPA